MVRCPDTVESDSENQQGYHEDYRSAVHVAQYYAPAILQSTFPLRAPNRLPSRKEYLLERLKELIELFSNPEKQYLKTQRLARIATVSKEGQPDVVPVGLEFDGEYFWVGSHSQEIFHRTRKYLNVRKGNPLVSLVVDDMESIDPWRPRGIKVYGNAVVMDHKGQFGPGEYLRVEPKTSWAWGIKGLKPKPGEFRVKTMHGRR